MSTEEQKNTWAAFNTLSTSPNFKGWNSRPRDTSRQGESQVAGFSRRQSINLVPGQPLQRRNSGTWNESGHKHEFHQMFPPGSDAEMARADNACQKMLSILCDTRQHQPARGDNERGTALSLETVALAVTQDARSGEKHVWIAANGPDLHRNIDGTANRFTTALRQKGVVDSNEAVELHFLKPDPAIRNAHAEMQLLHHLVSNGYLRSGTPGEGDQGRHRLTDFGTSKPACVGCGPFIDKALNQLAQPSFQRLDFAGHDAPVLFHTATTNSAFLVPVPARPGDDKASMENALTQFGALLGEPLPARTADADTQTPAPTGNRDAAAATPSSAGAPPPSGTQHSAGAPPSKPSYSSAAATKPSYSAAASKPNYSAVASRPPGIGTSTPPPQTRPSAAPGSTARTAPQARAPIQDRSVRMEAPTPQPSRTQDKTSQTDLAEPTRA